MRITEVTSRIKYHRKLFFRVWPMNSYDWSLILLSNCLSFYLFGVVELMMEALC